MSQSPRRWTIALSSRGPARSARGPSHREHGRAGEGGNEKVLHPLGPCCPNPAPSIIKRRASDKSWEIHRLPEKPSSKLSRLSRKGKLEKWSQPRRGSQHRPGEGACITQWSHQPCCAGPPKTDSRSEELWWNVVRCRRMANHSSVLAWRTPRTVWKGKKIWHWKTNAPRSESVQ